MKTKVENKEEKKVINTRPSKKRTKKIVNEYESKETNLEKVLNLTLGNEKEFLSLQEKDEVLNSFSDELFLEIIKEQIETNFSDLNNNVYKNNYIQIFNTRYNFIKNSKLAQNEDLISEINQMKINFFKNIKDMLFKKLGIIAHNFNNEESNAFFRTIEVLYEKFVLEYNDNIFIFTLDYIKHNKGMLSKEIASNNNSKLFPNYYRNISKDPYIVKIVSNIPALFSIITSHEYTFKQIIEPIIRYEEDESNNIFIKENIIDQMSNLLTSILRNS